MNPSHFWPCSQLLLNNCLLYGFSFRCNSLKVGQLSISICSTLSSPFRILTTFSKTLISPCLPGWHQCYIGAHLLLAGTQESEACQSSRFISSFFRCWSKREWWKIHTNEYLEMGNIDNTLCTDVMTSVFPVSFFLLLEWTREHQYSKWQPWIPSTSQLIMKIVKVCHLQILRIWSQIF